MSQVSAGVVAIRDDAVLISCPPPNRGAVSSVCQQFEANRPRGTDYRANQAPEDLSDPGSMAACIAMTTPRCRPAPRLQHVLDGLARPLQDPSSR
jgi:hypothetical protein